MNPRYYYPCEVGRAMTADARSPTELARDIRQRSRNLHSLGTLSRSSYQTVGNTHALLQLESPRFSHARSGGRSECAAVMPLSEPHRGACCARIPHVPCCSPFHSLARTPAGHASWDSDRAKQILSPRLALPRALSSGAVQPWVPMIPSQVSHSPVLRMYRQAMSHL